MWTRGRLSRNWWAPTRHYGVPARSYHPAGRWTRGVLHTGGASGLRMPGWHAGGGPRQGDAMDPSNPHTWRRPVQWTPFPHHYVAPVNRPQPPHAFGHGPLPRWHR